MKKPIIGVMGPGDSATSQDITIATEMGRVIAQNNWNLLTGGRDTGVMDAASKGAQQAGGLVIGILPTPGKDSASEYLDIPIYTGMGSARNNINVLSSDVVVVCGTGAGTMSEIMLTLKSQKPVIILHAKKSLIDFLADLPYPMPQQASSAKETVALIKRNL